MMQFFGERGDVNPLMDVADCCGHQGTHVPQLADCDI